MKWWKKIALSGAGLFFLVLGEGTRECRGFRMTHYHPERSNQHPNGPTNENRIVFLSDLHNRVYGSQNDILLEKIRKENINYDKWAAEGYVTVTPGNVIDYDFVKADILRIVADYDLRTSAYDRWNSSQTIIDLQNEGMECNPFGQGYGSMSAPTKEFEKLVLAGKVEHFGNPVLRWMLASTVVMTDPAGNIKPDKAKSSQKIDGIVASIMGLGEWMTAQAKEESNPYNKRGMRFL